jgi:hypothetical protein
LKIVEIASSVVDSISHLATLPVALPNWTNDLSPSRILIHLDSLMSSFRHKAAKSLVDLLCQKTAEVHARTGYCPPLSSRSIFDNNSNYNHTPFDEDDDATTDRGQNLLFLPTFDDALSSMETSLVLSTVNDVPHDYADQYRENARDMGITSSRYLSTAIFDQGIDQDVVCSSQQRLDSTFNPFISLHVGNNQGSFSTSGPFTPIDHESSNEAPSEALF